MLVKIYPENPNLREIDKVVNIMRDGGLVAFLVGMMVLGYCSYMLPDSVWQEQTLTPFAYSTLCLFRELAMLTVPFTTFTACRM